MRRPLLTLLLLLAPLAPAATDVSGKWSGSMDKKTRDGKVDSTPVIAEFKVDRKTVTGTANVPGFDPLPAGNGMLRGDRLTFEVHGDDGDYAVKLTLVGKSQLKGEVVFSAPDEARQTSSLTFTRNNQAVPAPAGFVPNEGVRDLCQNWGSSKTSRF